MDEKKTPQTKSKKHKEKSLKLYGVLAKGCDGQVVVENGFCLPLTSLYVGIHI